MKYLVTGGAGFIGSHITDKLIDLGHDVIVIDNLMLGKRDFVNKKAKFKKIDIRNYKKLSKAFKGMDGVFHLAADPRLQISIEDPITTHEINVTGTLNVLKAAVDNKVKKVIFSSSCSVYDDEVELPINEFGKTQPKNPYAMHKLIGEEYCRLFSSLYNLETVVLRYFNVYGVRKLDNGGYPMVIPIFLGQKKRGEKLTVVGDGKQTRDYVHVSDVVSANLKALESNIKNGDVVNVGSGKQISVNEIADLIGGKTEFLPQRPGEMRFIEADNKKAKEVLNWEPNVEFKQGLKNLKKDWGL